MTNHQSQTEPTRFVAIDDLFRYDFLESITDNARGELFEEYLESLDDEEFKEEILSLNNSVPINVADDFRPDFLLNMFNNLSNLTKRSLDLYDTVFKNEVETKIGDLNQLETLIRRKFQCESFLKLSDTADLPLEISTMDVVFIDYYLGDEQNAASKEASVNKINEVWDFFKDKPKPLVILMSSHDFDNDREAILDFNGKTPVVAGLFHFLHKNAVNNEDWTANLIRTLYARVDNGRIVQSFFEALSTQARQSSKAVISQLQTLSVEDIAHLQRLSLRDEGQPLGEYILWLATRSIETLFLQEESVTRARKSLDSIQLTSGLYGQLPPNTTFADVYKHVSFVETSDNDIYHPQAQPLDKRPLLRLGDAFVDSSHKELWLVINADCDLLWSVHGSRNFPSSTSVHFLPGRLQLCSDSIDKDDVDRPRIELFWFGNKKYRVFWNLSQLVSTPYSNVEAWLDSKHLKRIGRFRSEWALYCQNLFTANLTRVGLPVSPPSYQSAKISVFCRDSDYKFKELDSSQDFGAVFLVRDSKKGFVTKLSFYTKCLEQVVGWLRAARVDLESAANNAALRKQQTDKVKRALKLLEDVFEDVDKIPTVLDKVIKLPDDGKFFDPFENKKPFEKLFALAAKERATKNDNFSSVLFFCVKVQ